MSNPASRYDRGNGRPCPECGYALHPIDRVRDACRVCGAITPNPVRLRRRLRQRLGATANFLMPD